METNVIIELDRLPVEVFRTVARSVEKLATVPIEPYDSFKGRFEKIDSREIFVEQQGDSKYYFRNKPLTYVVMDNATVRFSDTGTIYVDSSGPKNLPVGKRKYTQEEVDKL